MTTIQTKCEFTGTTCDVCPSPTCYYVPDEEIEHDDYDDYRPRCEMGHDDAEECLFYCNYGGWYQPGTEDCDFCRYEAQCREFSAEKGGIGE